MFLILKLDPIDVKSITLIALPHLAKARIETVELRVTNESTDIAPPNLAFPPDIADIDEPTLTKFLILILEPIFK